MMLPTAHCRLITLGELDCLAISHPEFHAKLLLQGAQLIEFTPAQETNWLWLSPTAQYRRGSSVRGGIPICWPWFGNAEKNPEPVQQHITQPAKAPAHGYARTLLWQLENIQEHPHHLIVTLSLQSSSEHWLAPLQLHAEFKFSAQGLAIQLHTHNVSANPVSFSQALHTYFPTTNLSNTKISGFDGHSYIDTLDNWSKKEQQGDIIFTEETDRIYIGNAQLKLHSPDHILTLSATGSQSTVVWNPWIEKSKTLSQFSEQDYLQMFCVETANALQDAVHLSAQQSHDLILTLHR